MGSNTILRGANLPDHVVDGLTGRATALADAARSLAETYAGAWPAGRTRIAIDDTVAWLNRQADEFSVQASRSYWTGETDVAQEI